MRARGATAPGAWVLSDRYRYQAPALGDNAVPETHEAGMTLIRTVLVRAAYITLRTHLRRALGGPQPA